MFACLNRVMDWIVKVSRSSSARSNIKQEGEGTSNYQISFEIHDYSSEIRKGRSYGIQHIAFILRKGGNSRRHCLASYIQDSKELFGVVHRNIDAVKNGFTRTVIHKNKIVSLQRIPNIDRDVRSFHTLHLTNDL